MAARTNFQLILVGFLFCFALQPLCADEPKPNVLIIGDSISMGYGPIVTGLLANEANVSRPLNQNGGPLNCEGTTRSQKKIMRENGIAVNDLHSFVLPRMKQLLLPNNVHFKAAGSQALARKVAAAIRSTLPSENKRQAWEYKTISMQNSATSDTEMARKVNDLGEDGWQLVNVCPIHNSGTTRRLIFFLKRLK